METFAKVVAKSRNRTALGALHAYAVVYPDCCLQELRAIFNKEVCPDAGVKEVLLPLDQAIGFNAHMRRYFVKPDEVLKLLNGERICLSQIWSQASLDRLTARMAQLGFELAAPDRSQQYDATGFDAEIMAVFP